MSGKRRLAAERAAIRQRVRDDLARQQMAIRRQKEFTEKTRLWNELLLYWDQLNRCAKVEELCFKGIPPNIRGKVWPLLVGNELEITEERFDTLNREVHYLFRDNIMTASSRRTERVFEETTPTSYLTRSSHSENEEDDDENDDGDVIDSPRSAGSKAIPIPQQTTVDVTEEAWFENERSGSLDQETFGMIQRQLFGQANYWADRAQHETNDQESDGLDYCSKECSVGPLDSSTRKETRNNLQLDMPSSSPTRLSLASTSPTVDSPMPFAMSPPREPMALLVPGVTSPSQLTPPHRSRRSNAYLVEAGLVPDTKGRLRRKKLYEHSLSPEQLHKVVKAVSLIQWDLPRTFPTLAFFHDGGAMHTGLERVLLCFAIFRPDIGYVQGMSFLVATLLLYMDEFEAFKCLANLLSNRLYSDFYGFKKRAIDAYVKLFDHYFKKFLPMLYSHMTEEGVTSEMFLMDWNLSLYTKSLPLEVAANVWDVFLYEGESFLICVGLGILKMYAPMLSTKSVEQILPFLLHLPDDIKSEELFTYISQIKISRRSYEKLRNETWKKLEEAQEERSHPRRTSIGHSLRNALLSSGSHRSPSTISTATPESRPTSNKKSDCRQS